MTLKSVEEEEEIELRDFVRIKELPISKHTIVLSEHTQEWCLEPYKRYSTIYSEGCPNYGKERCPPNVPLVRDLKERYNYFKLVYAKFDFRKYKKKRKQHYPKYSEGQLGNLRQWQSSIKKMLSDYIVDHKLEYDTILGTGSGIKVKGRWYQSGESAGVNFFGTMGRNKIKLEKNPKKFIYLIVLLASKTKQMTLI